MLPLLTIAAGIAFAPANWRDVAQLAVLATLIFAAAGSILGVFAGNMSAVRFPDGLGRVISILTGLWVNNFVLLSIGFDLFRLLRKDFA
jgi:predicted Co/Zn/Cd cation transporter (cation efflux family)